MKNKNVINFPKKLTPAQREKLEKAEMEKDILKMRYSPISVLKYEMTEAIKKMNEKDTRHFYEYFCVLNEVRNNSRRETNE
jgi:hypothetical protein